MSTRAVPLDDLAQRLAQHQAELEALRREYEARQTQLTDLSRRKQELETQLHEVDADIQAVTHGTRPSSPTPRRAATPPARPAGQVPLPHLLVSLVQEAGHALTVKQLADEVIRRQFATSSGSIPRLIQTRVRELVRRGLLRRALHQPGFVLGKAANGDKTSPQRASHPAPKRPAASAPAAVTTKAHRKSPAKRRRDQPPLREVLTRLLARRKLPLSSGELAREALAAGYRTDSKDFAMVASVMLRKMDNVAHVPGRGYRLKK